MFEMAHHKPTKSLFLQYLQLVTAKFLGCSEGGGVAKRNGLLTPKKRYQKGKLGGGKPFKNRGLGHHRVQTTDQREQFGAMFWPRRDPNNEKKTWANRHGLEPHSGPISCLPKSA